MLIFLLFFKSTIRLFSLTNALLWCVLLIFWKYIVPLTPTWLFSNITKKNCYQTSNREKINRPLYLTFCWATKCSGNNCLNVTTQLFLRWPKLSVFYTGVSYKISWCQPSLKNTYAQRCMYFSVQEVSDLK